MVNLKEISRISRALKVDGIKLLKLYGDITASQQRKVLQGDLHLRGVNVSTTRGILTIESKEAYSQKIKPLQKLSEEIRLDILEMLKSTITKDTPSGSGHPGGSLSCVEILTVLYFGGILKYDPAKPNWYGRDRFILSKGHAAPTLYAVLARAYGLPKDELLTLRKLGSKYQGHPEKLMFPEGMIEISTGSLGQGLSAAVGMAIASRKIAFNRAQKIIKKKGIKDENKIIAKELNKSFRVFCLIGDGEENEGQIYEAANQAAALHLNNLIGILDWNRLSIDGPTRDVDYSSLNVKNKINKWKALGWEVIFVRKGHNIASLLSAFRKAQNIKNKPVMIIAQTVKGQGVSLMEEAGNKLDPTWHGKVPPAEEMDKALSEVRERIKTLSEIDTSKIKIYGLTETEKKILRPSVSPFKKRYKLPPIPPYSIEEQVSTRKAFARYLLEIAKVDQRIITLCADLSESVFPGLMKGLGILSPKNLGGRHIKMGVAEGNMPGVAAGLATCGFLPIIGTYDVFVLRELEQIRNTLSRDKTNVFIIGSHAGLGVGEDGGSHQSIETPGFMKDLPEIFCAEPSDGNETQEIMRRFIKDLNAGRTHGPFYFRLTRQDIPILDRPYQIKPGRGIYILKDTNKNEKSKINIVTSGAVVQIALEVSRRLEEKGIANRLLTLPISSWIEKIDLSKYFLPFTPILTIQDASTRVMGNILGRNLLRSRNFNPGMISSVGVVRYDRPVYGESGSWQELYRKYFNYSEIVEKALQLIKNQKRWLANPELFLQRKRKTEKEDQNQLKLPLKF